MTHKGFEKLCIREIGYWCDFLVPILRAMQTPLAQTLHRMGEQANTGCSSFSEGESFL